VLGLAERLLVLQSGEEVVLNGLGMRLHGKKTSEDMPGPELLHIGLRAAIQVLQKETDLRGNLVDDFMESVVAAALQSDDRDGLKHQWLDAVFSAIDRHYGFMHDYRKTIQTTVELIPEAFLSRLFTGSEDQRVMRLFFMRGSLGDTPLLSGVDIETLINWCSCSDDPGLWASVPQGLELWVSVSDSSGTVLHKNAVKLLEAAPDPSVVLESFADLTSPTSSIGRTGHIANILQARADAFGELIHHQRADISKAARDIHESLMLMIERQRDREQLEDRKGEQRFE